MRISQLQTCSGIAIVPVAVEHAAALAALVGQNREHLRHYLPGAIALSSPEAAQAHLQSAQDRAARADVFEWHLFAGASLCGAVRLKHIDAEHRTAQIGYFLGHQFSGKGIITSALGAVLDDCFTSLALNRIELRCAAGNTPSMRVAQKLGFQCEGILREAEFLHGAYVDHHVYGLLAREFQAR